MSAGALRAAYPTKTVDDLCALVVDCPHSTPEWTKSGVVVLRSRNIRNGRLALAEQPSFTTERDYAQRVQRAIPQGGDLVITREAPMGEVCMLPPGLRCCLGQRMVLLRPDPARVDGRFLLFALQSASVQHQIGMHEGTGSTVSNLRIPALKALHIPCPPLGEQRAIAHILGALDDKIELNRRMNETLEAMARALFKSWFVDFDPVRAKAQGQTPPGMDPATAALFPSEFQDSELGEIPKGWRISTLKNETTKIGSGATPRGGESAYIDDGIALIRSQNVYNSQFVWDGLARITDEAATKLAGVTVEHGDVLMNITGASILRTCVVEPEVLPARVNQHVSIVRSKPSIPNRYIHFHLLNPRTKDYLLGMDAGASRQAVTKGHIESVAVIVPVGPVLARFDELVRPLFSSADLNNAQSRRLTEARDALLPRLLSGELSVAQTAQAVEATA